MSRGDRREAILLDDVDRQDFLKTLADACQNAGWQVHAYCLMNNHFHLVMETPDANLVEGMRWMLSAYTVRLNHRHKPSAISLALQRSTVQNRPKLWVDP